MEITLLLKLMKKKYVQSLLVAGHLDGLHPKHIAVGDIAFQVAYVRIKYRHHSIVALACIKNEGPIYIYSFSPMKDH